MYAGLSILQRVLLPPTCVLCAGAGHVDAFDMCAACANELPVNANACTRCGEQLSTDSNVALLCGACLRKPPRYHRTHCAFRYSYPIDHLIRAFKYHGRLTNGRVLGQLLARSLADTQRTDWPEAMIPVPLADARFAERGFNQAIEIAKPLQARLNIPLRADVIVRKRNTREQAGLDRLARRKNLRGAFVLRTPLVFKHIAIVDDVVTTGSTVNEVARVLRRAGAKRVEVWAVARASR